MKILKYKTPLIALVIYCVYVIYIHQIMWPGLPNSEVTILFLLLFYPLFAFIGIILGGYLLSPVYLFLHKKILGRKMNYGFVDKSGTSSFNKTWRGIFPALMAISLSLRFVFDESIQTFIVELLPEPVFYLTVQIIFPILVCIFILIAGLFFGGIWFLLDAGIMYSNEEKVRNTDKPVENKSVGGYFQILLKGYAGISAIIGYYVFFLYLFNYAGFYFSLDLILMYGFNFLFPLVVAISFQPTIILTEVIKQKRIEYVRKMAKNFGIDKQVETTFKEVNN